MIRWLRAEFDYPTTVGERWFYRALALVAFLAMVIVI